MMGMSRSGTLTFTGCPIPDEVWELGLDEAFDRAITLVEWPDRLGAHLPPDALRLRLEPFGEGRRAVLSGGRDGLLRALADG
jgi:tRNA threonylcarbamoyladenosine biosynthesis protein TsaE